MLNFMWLHSIIVEKLRYKPLGWSKAYEFNDSDLIFLTDIGLRFLEAAVEGKSHFCEDEIPLSAIPFIISNVVYGGRIDNENDHRVLKAIAQLSLQPDVQFPSNSKEEFTKWLDKCEGMESPNIVQMPGNVGKFLFTREGVSSLRNILAVSYGVSKTVEKKDFVKAVLENFVGALESSPVKTLQLTEGRIKDVIDEEMMYLKKTRDSILTDCTQILATMEKGDALTDKHLVIITSIEKSVIPDGWNAHKFQCSDLFAWIGDFTARISAINTFDCGRVNLGLLMSPESLLVACRQTAARKRQLPLDAVKIVCKINGKCEEQGDILVTGMASICGEWKEDKLCVSDEVSSVLPPLLIGWDTGDKGLDGIKVPCFMTNEKRRMIFEAVLPVSDEKSRLWWVARNPFLVLQRSDI
jgi:dynein heavy chain 1